ncbi:MAG: hypothetical protein ABH836_07910 [Candidatus Omnitrophota bacterium]
MKSKGIYFVLFILIAAGIAFFALNIYRYYRGDTADKRERLLVPEEWTQKKLEYKIKVPEKKLDYYLNIFKGKELFKTIVKEKIPVAEKSENDVLMDLRKELSKYELVGVISSDGVSKALIKDTQTGKTFYCSGGENMDGFLVKDVLPNKVILEKEGRTLELGL